jgi:hypothetical protein
MSDGHVAREFCHLGFIEDLCNKAFTSHSIEFAFRIDCHDTAALLSSVLKGMETVVCETGRILNTIDAKYTTLVV